MVGQPGAESSLRCSTPYGGQQIRRPENLPGLGHNRTMKRGDEDVAQAADKIGLQMPK
jgi:hypothetical protein